MQIIAIELPTNHRFYAVIANTSYNQIEHKIETSRTSSPGPVSTVWDTTESGPLQICQTSVIGAQVVKFREIPTQRELFLPFILHLSIYQQFWNLIIYNEIGASTFTTVPISLV